MLIMLGDTQQENQALQEPGRVMIAHVAGNAVAGRTSDTGADLLHNRHQRIGKKHLLNFFTVVSAVMSVASLLTSEH
jgi:hypothetical protein